MASVYSEAGSSECLWFVADLPDERRNLPVQYFPEIELHCLRCAFWDVTYALFYNPVRALRVHSETGVDGPTSTLLGGRLSSVPPPKSLNIHRSYEYKVLD